ncbi:MAG: UDP-N-acetylglucosamine 2-epimerase [Shewanella sp.]
MHKKIAVFTGTRADYGLLYWLLKDIQQSDILELQLIVSGSHLAPEFGYTVEQIEKDGFFIDEKVEMLLSSNSAVGTAKSVGLGIIGYAEALDRLKPDVLVILGDRFEALAIAQTATILKIPLLHIHGGEVTEGAYDDAFRHAITKLSHVHCTAAETYRQRVIQMGEMPDSVHNVGAIGLEHIHRSTFMTREQLSSSLGANLINPYFLVTYHQTTLANEPAAHTFKALIASLEQYPDYKVIMTYPNPDNGGGEIIALIEEYARHSKGKVLAIPSLGQIRYLSCIKYATAVIGNSSSGIIEVPSFNVPTVNIGARQQGRLAAKSVISCQTDTSSITTAIKNAILLLPKLQANPVENPYGQGNTSQYIVKLLTKTSPNIIKSFYDIKV